MNIDFDANKAPVEVIKKIHLEELILDTFISVVNRKWYRKSWKEFNEFNEFNLIDQNYYCSKYYDASVNKYKVKCGTSLRFYESSG